MSTTLSPDELADVEQLLWAARDARERAYAPYSKFAVGAALDVGDGHAITGANVENASYGLTICAERTAIAAAVAAGFRTFSAIAIAGPEDALTSPCGACRQVMVEFNPKMVVYFTSPDGVMKTTAEELLPHSFGPFV